MRHYIWMNEFLVFFALIFCSKRKKLLASDHHNDSIQLEETIRSNTLLAPNEFIEPRYECNLLIHKPLTITKINMPSIENDLTTTNVIYSIANQKFNCNHFEQGNRIQILRIDPKEAFTHNEEWIPRFIAELKAKQVRIEIEYESKFFRNQISLQIPTNLPLLE